MLPSLSMEWRLPVGVDREPFSSLTRDVAPPKVEPEPCDPSRLVSPRSWCFFDLKRKAMADCSDRSSWCDGAGMLAERCCDVGGDCCRPGLEQVHVAQLTEQAQRASRPDGTVQQPVTPLAGACRVGEGELRGPRRRDAGDGVDAREQRWPGEHWFRGGVGAARTVRALVVNLLSFF